MKTIVCAIQKGGQGKSMLSTHLAFLGAEQGRSVLAVDLDGQGTLTRNLYEGELDRDASPSLSLFTGTLRKPTALDLPFKVKGGVSVMTGDRRLVQIDETPKISASALRDRLADCAGGADLVVLDPPPTLGKRLRAALIAADFVVMPFVPARESVDGLGDLMDTISEIQSEYNPALQVIGLLANKVNSRSKFDQRILDQLEEAAPGMVMTSVIHERTSVSGAMSASRPVWFGTSGASQREAAAEVRAACDHILTTVFAS
ncbi:ParA family protein (plasmid) [Paracidovorax citrulli]|uniref:ParA family protein n=1 Tax=Paracidovorax citrulli TaxID=80869 RepID=UPI0002DDC9DE|nr:ParA family protein [Paracidovorax citrulli]QCX13195.1 Chromosome-partitioning ParAf [Paracidovorax citrulli]UMT93568.1 ParA family protein [Paracidovorax citrulli]